MKGDGKIADEARFTPGRWTIQSPARLHFGLMEICPGEPSLFAGCGMTVDEPATHLSLEVIGGESNNPSGWQIECDSPWKERIESACKLTFPQTPIAPWKFVFRLEKPPLSHAGLGSGTQLACCVATLIASAQCDAFLGAHSVPAHQIWNEIGASNESNIVAKLADASGRGSRSFVGLASHLFGGFIVDHGIQDADNKDRMIDRVAQPETWRVLLVRPKASTTVSGSLEIDYFRRCALANVNRERMIDLIAQEIVPAIQSEDINRFGEALFDYGRMGGELFRAVQGGVYRDATVSSLVDSIRGLGVAATGQTSWGPTVYAIVESAIEATWLEENLRNRWGTQIITTIARPSNQSSIVVWVPQETDTNQ